MKRSRTNLPLLFVVLLVSVGLFGIGWHLIRIDTDIVASLPLNDPVIDDAVFIFDNHPFRNQITIDVALDQDDVDTLVDCGRAVSRALTASGMFHRVGMEHLAGSLPQLMQTVVDQLPTLFTADMLATQVAPMLSPDAISRRVERLRSDLLQMDGIGQAAAIAKDPLGLKDLLMAKLIHLAPTQTARVYKDQLISGDGRHLLITAVPSTSATETDFARRLSDYLERMSAEIEAQFAARGVVVTLTPIGAYRAALDNETIVRSDVQKAIAYAAIGIALLLMAAFPRPLIGLLSLLPAVVGTLVAFFVFSLLQSKISAMVLGFGGAIISITVDHGIAYLLFLDRPKRSYGKKASKEAWAVGLLPVLTTMGAFGALMLSDFPVLQQLGLFTMLGIGFSFLFVHFIFPLIFPSLKAAREKRLALPVVADRLFAAGKSGAAAAVAIFAIMLFFVTPKYQGDIEAMNTVTPATKAAEKRVADAWGDLFSRVFIMTEAPTLGALQEKNDRLLAALEEDANAGLATQAFLPSMLFPGEMRGAANLAAWKAFWTPERTTGLASHLKLAGVQAGFREDAFVPFLQRVRRPETNLSASAFSPAVLTLMGISGGTEGHPWRQFTTLTLPSGYSEERFYTRFGELARIFAPGLFSDRLGGVMAHTFLRLLCIVGAAVVVLLLLFFLDLKLTLIALAPVIFAMVCTLGTLDLLGRSMDIPGLILAVVVLGMGIDYSLFIVRAYQRYGDPANPSFRLVRAAVLMTGASTLIGFGVLANADHALLNSAGVTSSLGIAYSLIGVFLLLPPMLERYFDPRLRPSAREEMETRSRVMARYRRLEPFARQFARFKMKLDPLFRELSDRVRFPSSPRVFVDVGTGFGVPACWLVESYPRAILFGIDPDEDRVRVANRALNDQGNVICAAAPTMPAVDGAADGAFMLDVAHFLSDEHLRLTLERLYDRLSPGALLVMRCVMPPGQPHRPVRLSVDKIVSRLKKEKVYYRSASTLRDIVSRSGFLIQDADTAGRNKDMLWINALKATRQAVAPK